MKVKKRYPTTFTLEVDDCETPTGVSMTVPDGTMSINEIYKRFVTGRTVDASTSNSIFYGDDIEMPNLKALDLVDIGIMLENVRENRGLLEDQSKRELEALRQLEAEKSAREKKIEDERLLKLYEERKNANAK